MQRRLHRDEFYAKVPVLGWRNYKVSFVTSTQGAAYIVPMKVSVIAIVGLLDNH